MIAEQHVEGVISCSKSQTIVTFIPEIMNPNNELTYFIYVYIYTSEREKNRSVCWSKKSTKAHCFLCLMLRDSYENVLICILNASFILVACVAEG